jgi:hypothetical protein
MLSAILLGYDPREDDAFEVCKYSIQKFSARANFPPVIPLKMGELRRLQMYDRPYRMDANGQRYDETDGLPFSTEFSFTRFLTPHYAKALGFTGHVLFVDSDFIFLRDPNEVLETGVRDYPFACTKHRWENIKEGKKMDGQIQSLYSRKLWSSFMLFDLDSYDWDSILSPEVVNHRPGGWLHGLEWMEENPIGSIPLDWNYIPGFSPPCPAPKAIHYSMEAPWFNEQMHWVHMFAEMKGAYL